VKMASEEIIDNLLTNPENVGVSDEI